MAGARGAELAPSGPARSSRGRWLFAAGAALVLVLAGGRFVAIETAERAWAATIAAGNVYLDARTLARLVRVATFLLACFWGVANFYIVYRAIGSVQMPRQVGNLEIVEAVPQRFLLGLALVVGLVFGIGLAWGTEDWWLEILLASGPPVFGRVDPVLHRDLGYYIGTLPWELTRQRFFLLATLTASIVIGILYTAIGSLRFERRKPVASPHARAHLGVLLAGLALALVWGAVLDPAEVVAGLHGAVDGAMVGIRIPGASLVALAGGFTAVATLIWTWWGRPGWLAAGWGVALAAMLGVYAVAPPLARSSRGTGRDSSLALARRDFTRRAFGGPDLAAAALPQFVTLADFIARVPLWDESRVAAVAHRWVGAHQTVGGVTMGNGPEWLVAPTPDDTALSRSPSSPTWEEIHRGSWSAAGAPLRLLESDSGLVLAAPPSADTVQWFGPLVAQYAVVDAERHPDLAPAGVRITGGWRRLALAWTLQSPELARGTTVDQLLLWRRGASDRFERLAPFADFDTPVPLVADGALWWVAYGYVGSELFPLVGSTRWRNAEVRYLRAGLIGAVRAGTGETRFWMVPGGDPLAAAWARLFAPLVQPAESLPPSLRRVLPMPHEAFRQAERSMLAEQPDSGKWRRVAPDPFEIPEPLLPPSPASAISPGAPAQSRPWIAQAFATGTPGHYVGFLAGQMTPDGPAVLFFSPPSAEPAPGPVVGAAETMPGVLRLWPTQGHIAAAQGRFERSGTEPTAAPSLERVFLSWADRTGDAPERSLALRSLVSSGSFGNASDTSLAGRWREAQGLAAKADSALVAGNLEEFGRWYRALTQLLGHRRPALAPAPTPR
ncbi:MAG TPA: UPF0182 family protein [Gemmatimonadales bacterium]|nr:UPF0182 family protein [Gemmatimonadales bacterium]